VQDDVVGGSLLTDLHPGQASDLERSIVDGFGRYVGSAEQLRELGPLVLWQGAQAIRFDER